MGKKDNRNRNNKEIYGQLIYFDHFFIFYKGYTFKKISIYVTEIATCTYMPRYKHSFESIGKQQTHSELN